MAPPKTYGFIRKQLNLHSLSWKLINIYVGSYGWNSFLAYLQFCQQEVAMPGKKVKITAATHHLNGALEIWSRVDAEGHTMQVTRSSERRRGYTTEGSPVTLNPTPALDLTYPLRRIYVLNLLSVLNRGLNSTWLGYLPPGPHQI